MSHVQEEKKGAKWKKKKRGIKHWETLFEDGPVGVLNQHG